jgi:hypothetical protein
VLQEIRVCSFRQNSLPSQVREGSKLFHSEFSKPLVWKSSFSLSASCMISYMSLLHERPPLSTVDGIPPQQFSQRITPPHYHFVYSQLFGCTIDVSHEKFAGHFLCVSHQESSYDEFQVLSARPFSVFQSTNHSTLICTYWGIVRERSLSSSERCRIGHTGP